MKYMLSKVMTSGKWEGEPTLGTFDKAFGSFPTDASARRHFALQLQHKEFAAGDYAIFRNPNSSDNGTVVHTMKKVQATHADIR